MNKLKYPKLTKKWLKKIKEPSYQKLVKELDKAFSQHLKQKTKGKCARCGQVRANAGVSHFWSRRYKGTRWDEENCDWLCWLPCHYEAEHQKNGWYQDFMLKKLGQRRFDNLRIKAESIAKFTRSEIQILINLYEKI